jgi:hypothetical protein
MHLLITHWSFYLAASSLSSFEKLCRRAHTNGSDPICKMYIHVSQTQIVSLHPAAGALFGQPGWDVIGSGQAACSV